VSERTQEEIETAFALERVEIALHELTSNLLRIVRGAGMVEDILPQVVAFTEAMDAHWEMSGGYASSHDLQQSLDILIDEEFAEKISFGENVKEYAMHSIICGSLQIICGSLQMIASRLVNQGTQVSKGENDFFQTYNVLQEHRKEMRTRAQQEAAAMGMKRKAPVRRKSATKPKAPKA
jgi:hypothetical protein